VTGREMSLVCVEDSDFSHYDYEAKKLAINIGPGTHSLGNKTA
jgi:hypothetical protein